MAGPKEAEEPSTAIMPVRPVRDPTPPGDATVTISPDQRFDIAASGPSKTHAAPRPALDFSQIKNIDRFELIRELARGGMGQVFLARDTKLGRKVAIKFLLHDDPDFVQRFLVEARATARCTHENIVTIHEVGEHAGLPYMVLEYLEGKTLSDVLDRNPSLKTFTELMVPVVRALERAHEHGIVHRDLKPSNIFVTDRGQVKVLDFGVARMIDRAGAPAELVKAGEARALRFSEKSSSVTFTGDDSLVGTLPYMSPEQWGAGVVDHQSDIWAVGIMFWRALTNVHPAGTTAPDKLRVRLLDLDTPLQSIAEKDAAIPTELALIVDRCVRKHKEDRYQNASELLADLQKFLTPGARASEDVCPYRGLAAFGEADAKYFFGRGNEVRTARSQLDSWPLLAVIGPSGVGKSSFVHAGLVPAVRASGARWKVHVVRPGRVPLHRLANILEDSLGTGQESQGGDILGQLRDSPGVFGKILRAAATKKNEHVLVVVDQLEELFTLCDSDEIRSAFLAALLAAADDPTSPVRVVLSMRADFLDRLAGHKQFLAELSRGLFFLTAPDHDNLREVLERPAELAGYTFEDRSIVEDMMQAATSRGALPLLSFAASRLWDTRDRNKKQLTVAAYKQMGGVGGAFARHADQVAAAVPAQQQILLRAILTRLVTPDGTRAIVDQAELYSLGSDVEGILDQLARARLINLNVDPDQGATVEIVHEMLITEWPTLKRWLEDGKALRGFLHELGQAARQWVARGKPTDLLWRGQTAQEALAHARRHVLDLSGAEQEFLAAVRAYAARRRRVRLAASATIVLALLAVIAGGAFAIVRIRAAEQDALEKAIAAGKAAEEARAAQTQVQSQLDQIRSAQAAREKAEAEKLAEAQKVVEAQGEVSQSHEELQKSYDALKKALGSTEAARHTAEVNAETARKATDEANKAKATAERLYQEQQAHVKELENRMHEIYSGDLLKKKKP